MFTSPLGTWIPFALIFASTYSVGSLLEKFLESETTPNGTEWGSPVGSWLVATQGPFGCRSMMWGS